MLAVLGWRTGRGATAGLLEAAPEFDAFDFEKIYHALVMIDGPARPSQCH